MRVDGLVPINHILTELGGLELGLGLKSELELGLRLGLALIGVEFGSESRLEIGLNLVVYLIDRVRF